MRRFEKEKRREEKRREEKRREEKGREEKGREEKREGKMNTAVWQNSIFVDYYLDGIVPSTLSLTSPAASSLSSHTTSGGLSLLGRAAGYAERNIQSVLRSSADRLNILSPQQVRTAHCHSLLFHLLSHTHTLSLHLSVSLCLSLPLLSLTVCLLSRRSMHSIRMCSRFIFCRMFAPLSLSPPITLRPWRRSSL